MVTAPENPPPGGGGTENPRSIERSAESISKLPEGRTIEPVRRPSRLTVKDTPTLPETSSSPSAFARA